MHGGDKRRLNRAKGTPTEGLSRGPFSLPSGNQHSAYCTVHLLLLHVGQFNALFLLVFSTLDQFSANDKYLTAARGKFCLLAGNDSCEIAWLYRAHRPCIAAGRRPPSISARSILTLNIRNKVERGRIAPRRVR
jgi:hypothetical protein